MTVFMLKPDGIAHHYEIMEMIFEIDDLQIVRQYEFKLTRDQVAGLYAAHVEKPYFPPMVEYMTSGLVLANILRGPNAISRVREILGSTWPKDADPDSIRGRYGVKEALPSGIAMNVAHSTDATENFAHEVQVIFGYLAFGL